MSGRLSAVIRTIVFDDRVAVTVDSVSLLLDVYLVKISFRGSDLHVFCVGFE